MGAVKTLFTCLKQNKQILGGHEVHPFKVF